MHPDDLAARYPSLYHMAEAGSWASIREVGLLTTAQLVERFPPDEAERSAVLDRPRSRAHVLDRERVVVVRDQLPLDADRLEAVLVGGMTVAGWLAELNTRVFFWVAEAKLVELLCARRYRDRAHDVLVLDTAALLAAHADRVRLTTFNSGTTTHYPNRPVRGPDTFMTVADFPHGERRSTGSRRTAAVELAVTGGVPDVRDLVLRVERRRGAEPGDVVYEAATTSR